MFPLTAMSNNSGSKKNLEVDHWLSLDTETGWRTCIPFISGHQFSALSCKHPLPASMILLLWLEVGK